MWAGYRLEGNHLRQSFSLGALPLEKLLFPRPIDGVSVIDARPEVRWTDSLIAPLIPDNDWYGSLAVLFAEAFPRVPAETVEILGRSAQLCARSLIVADKIIDGDENEPAIRLTLGLLALQYETYTLLTTIFHRDSPFWRDFDRYFDRVVSAIQRERELKQTRHQVTFAEMLDLAADKNALHCGIAAAFCVVDDRRIDLPSFEESLEAFTVATQLVDDVHDWKRDLQSMTPSSLNVQHEILQRYIATSLSLEDAAACLFGDRLVSNTLSIALERFHNAEARALDCGLTRWARFLSTRAKATADFLHQIDSAHERQSRWISDVASKPADVKLVDDSDRVLVSLMRKITASWRSGFPELQHLMRFPRLAGFTGEVEVKRGDVFQRALILDTLLTGREILSITGIDAVIQTESDYLICAAERDPLGHRTWKYFFDLPELPADLDDLAEILRVGSKWPSIQEDLKRNIASISHSQSGIPNTWIIPRDSAHALHLRQHHHANVNWGRASDVEVVANYVDALAQYDPTALTRYAHLPAFLVSSQEADGFWKSTWYEGPYYGSFVVLRALQRFEKAQSMPAIEKCGDALDRSFKSHGWGLSPEADRTSTALALLAIDAARSLGASFNANQVLTAIAYLSEPTASTTTPVPFIKMTVPTVPPSVVTYQSKILEDSLVLRALLKWRVK